MPTPASSPGPSIGLGTKLGVTGVTGGVAAAIVAVILGDRSEQTLGVLAGAAVTVVFGAVTIGGRMLQAALRDRGRDDVANLLDEWFDDLADKNAKSEELALTALKRADAANARISRQEEGAKDGDGGGYLEPSGRYLEASGPTFGSVVYGDPRTAPAIVGDLPLAAGDELVDEDLGHDLEAEDLEQPKLMEVPPGRDVDEPPVPDLGDVGPNGNHRGEEPIA